MPLTSEDRKMETHFEQEYGPKGKGIWYATLNKRINEGKPVKVGESAHLKAKRKNKRSPKRKARRGKRR